MFGHQDDKTAQKDSDAIPEKSINGVLSDTEAEPVQSAEQPATTESTDTLFKPDTEASAPEPSTDVTASTASDQPFQHPGTPLANEANGKEQIKDIISPAGGFPKRPTYQYPLGVATPIVSPISLDDTTDTATHELIDIRQKALGELAPLIDQLDLPPEEKFHTIMMMIQASDDQTMVKAAYAAAHSIEDEKPRAQALLDIINEVNYFTQPPEA